MQNIVFQLGIEWDALSGDTIHAKAESLVREAAKHNKLVDLFAHAKAERDIRRKS